jgi:hypothetical protein
MSDSGFDWEYTRTAFRKALVDCRNVTNDVSLSEGLDLLADIHGCSLLMLHFRDRLSLKQQKALSDLAAACDDTGIGIHGEPERDDEDTRSHFEDAFKHARESTPIFDGI